MNLEHYIDKIKEKLNFSLIIESFEIIDEKILFKRGYFRARITLINQDFLEIAESFTLIEEEIESN